MRGIAQNFKRALPEPVKILIKLVINRLKNWWFEPYLKKKNIEGAEFDFWIIDADGLGWYNFHCTDSI